MLLWTYEVRVFYLFAAVDLIGTYQWWVVAAAAAGYAVLPFALSLPHHKPGPGIAAEPAVRI